MRVIFDIPPKIQDTNLIDYSAIDPDHSSTNRIFRNTDLKTVKDKMIAEYSGELDLEVYDRNTYFPPVIPPTHRTRLKSGEIIALLKDPTLPTKGSYAKIFRAAYPQGNKAEDDIALEFLEQAKHPYSDDGLIDVADIEDALDYFVTQSYMDAGDKTRVMQGWPV